MGLRPGRRPKRRPYLRRLDCACDGRYLSTPVGREMWCKRPVIDYSQAGQLYAVFAVADELAEVHGLKFYDLLPDTRGMSPIAALRTRIYHQCFRLEIDPEVVALAFNRSVGSINVVYRRWKDGERTAA